jgi:hypothetical protein
VELLEVSSMPEAAALGAIGPAHTAVVDLLGDPRGKLLARVADPLHPPELAGRGYRRHMIIQLDTEHMIEVGLAEFRLVDDIAGRSDGEVTVTL